MPQIYLCPAFLGVLAPSVLFIDLSNNVIFLERILDSETVRDRINRVLTESDPEKSLQIIAEKIGSAIGLLHKNNIIHGDLTTSNMLMTSDDSLYMIDFGLSMTAQLAEHKGVDLYVLERAMLSTHPKSGQLFEDILKFYTKCCGDPKPTLDKFEEVRLRGRKRIMIG
jgi:TP53 regulating kinase-like protein